MEMVGLYGLPWHKPLPVACQNFGMDEASILFDRTGRAQQSNVFREGLVEHG